MLDQDSDSVHEGRACKAVPAAALGKHLLYGDPYRDHRTPLPLLESGDPRREIHLIPAEELHPHGFRACDLSVDPCLGEHDRSRRGCLLDSIRSILLSCASSLSQETGLGVLPTLVSRRDYPVEEVA